MLNRFHERAGELQIIMVDNRPPASARKLVAVEFSGNPREGRYGLIDDEHPILPDNAGSSEPIASTDVQALVATDTGSNDASSVSHSASGNESIAGAATQTPAEASKEPHSDNSSDSDENPNVD
jgi:hypothetical protein